MEYNNIDEVNINTNYTKIVNEMKKYRLEKIKLYQELLLNKFESKKIKEYIKLNNYFIQKSQCLFIISIDLILFSNESLQNILLNNWINQINNLYEKCIERI